MSRLLPLLLMFGLLLTVMASAQDEPLFHVVTNNNLNLRACASTDCERVGQVPGGTELPVHAIEGDWYQVLADGELVWVAGWLTRRAPDKILETKEFYRDRGTGCYIGVKRESGDRDLVVLLTGENRREAGVKVYRPGDSDELRTQGRFDDSFIDTGEPYILQYYSRSVNWPNGLYRIEVTLGRATSIFGWEMKRYGEYTVHVYCEQAAAPNPTLPPRPTHTPRPTRTPRPTHTPTRTPDKVLRSGELYWDRNTGCDIMLGEEGYDGDLNILLAEDRREDVEVRIFRPNAGVSLPVSGQFNDTFSDSGEPFIWQYYIVDYNWRAGLYRLEITLDDRSSLLAWNLERSGDQIIYIFCDRPVPRPTNAPQLPTDSPQSNYYVTIGNVNVRSCPRVSCTVLGRFSPGTSVEVIREVTGEQVGGSLRWSVVLLPGDSRYAYVPSSMLGSERQNGTPFATPTPPPTVARRATSTPRPTATPRPSRTPTSALETVLKTDEIHWDRNTGCDVLVGNEGYDGNLNIVLAGDRRNDVEVAVMRPGASFPLRISGRFDDVIEDSREPFIWQYYSIASPWPDGLYRLEITLDGRASLLAWQLERGGDQVIYVFCDGPVPRPTRTPRPTVARRATSTPRPTRVPPPTYTSVPTSASQSSLTEIRTGVVHQDAATGCNVLVLVFPPEQESWKDLWVVRDGENRHDVWVNISFAGSDSPLTVEDEFHDVWDSGEPGVWQTYSPYTDWRDGLYRIELGLHDATSTLTWRLEGPGYYQIHVSCYLLAGPAPSV